MRTDDATSTELRLLPDVSSQPAIDGQGDIVVVPNHDVVTCVAVVTSNGVTWAKVLTSKGVEGYLKKSLVVATKRRRVR